MNYQAAMALSGATGLIDIASQYGLAVDPIPEKMGTPPNVSLLGGNGGIDSINSVVLFSKEKPKPSREPFTLKPLEVNVPSPKTGEKATILTVSTIYFNPGGEKTTLSHCLFYKRKWGDGPHQSLWKGWSRNSIERRIGTGKIKSRIPRDWRKNPSGSIELIQKRPETVNLWPLDSQSPNNTKTV